MFFYEFEWPFQIQTQMRVMYTWATTWQNQQTKMCPQQRQISLHHRPVWSESLLSAWKQVRYLATHKADSDDTDQTGRMPGLIWVFAGDTCHFVGFVMRWLTWLYAERNDFLVLHLKLTVSSF